MAVRSAGGFEVAQLASWQFRMSSPLTPQSPESNPSPTEPVDPVDPVEPVGPVEPPAPLPYHGAIRDHFRDREPRLWKWFHERETPEALRDNVRHLLLKSAFRLDREDRADLYAIADDVALRVGVHVPAGERIPITLYQAQSGEGMNAGLHFAPGEIHVVLQGPMLERLTDAELRAVLGHEFSHFTFLMAHCGEFGTTLAVIDALTSSADAEFSHLVTARHFDLYTEILCDRGALLACGDPLPSIAALVKVATGLQTVNPESYVRQADEIFAKGQGKVQSEEGSHPETFIRTRALMLFAESGEAAEPAIAAMIEGPPTLDALDLPGQVQVSGATRALITALLDDPKSRTVAHVAQAHLYFEDFQVPKTAADRAQLYEAMRCEDGPLRDYYCYVVIDFVAADREVLDLQLARGLAMVSKLGWADRLAELAAKELEKIRAAADKLAAGP